MEKNKSDCTHFFKWLELNKYYITHNIFQETNISDHNVEKLYDLVIDGNEEIGSDGEDGEYYLCVGAHYKKIENYEKMKKYYTIAIEKNSTEAMYILARYYIIIERDYEKMENYSLMAAEKGNIDAMCMLCQYYIGHYEFDINKKKISCFMAKLKGNKNAIKQINRHLKLYVIDYVVDFILDNIECIDKDIIIKANRFLLGKNELDIDYCSGCCEEKHVCKIRCSNKNLCLDCLEKLNECPLCCLEL